MKYKRIFTIVMDSVGCGEMPDAERYGDRGADTIGHIAKTVGGLTMPAMEKLGYGNLHPILGVEPQRDPQGYYTKMLEASVGKDTMTGHWEMMGLYIDKPFQTFTETGFPQELIDELEKRTGYKIVGNKSASGTEILDELGEHHMKTKELIVYTSADSVLQIAAHEEIFGLEELYRCCEIARELTMRDEWKVGRVIARPFVGEGKGHFTRTSNRHDLALKPFGRTVLNELKDQGFDVISVGKIKDIFDGEGVSEAYKSTSSHHGMEQTLELTQKDFTGLCFVNLVDFDAKWGHRRNPQGYAQELEDYDQLLQNFLSQLREDDLVIITADHGNDPCHTGTDHTREMVPLILYSPSHQGSGLLPLANTFANLGATVADNFKVTMPAYGTSYLKFLK
ncbi:phosphopentomutase [Holdemania massiliensis]|uniref:Phosphopentomutase n=1 Tax=Holdemania massiliensis TaxID=1468449 RepID=A0A6N7S6V4_9FIRM|nr:phosphopentomutase [Holdemania massiliensis]MSA71183.1 phosphopentomutase [Holdemania massiliensis]MSA89509.1 phosphopentomutase [Holdemania massiliensis]MSB78191.1 phosphopentomutase [Holdemania massiliensis]MSC33187.1 phosphopentomutase [Holdemania massiliensis]MSC39502.1 phosphopentomutase [Holdemania massiliensis]